ncbi:DUF692 domain-containing protein [Novosphingobium sp.]|uniref:MNIO family bufferin maturase n=1 Tax=Novosphingobium sp. TaxID=1874826 RepID=UPI003BAA046F
MKEPIPSSGLAGLPLGVGIGLKREHCQALLADPSPVDFVEVHAENFMSDGGPNLVLLDRIAETWPLSIHGVALSLGGEAPLDLDHLKRLRRLLDRAQPASFSEHLAWSSHDGVYFNDLLPVVYDTVTLGRVIDHIDLAQGYLGRRILLENPSTYVEYGRSTWHEAEFLGEIARKTGCGLLLDLNNLYVSSQNHGWEIGDWLNRYPLGRVGEIHLAGHEGVVDEAGQPLLIDSHGDQIAEPVYDLLAQVTALAGPRPVLIERDNNVPPLGDLLQEVMLVRNFQACAARFEVA